MRKPPVRVRASRLPDGRYELAIKGCPSAVVSPELYRESDRYRLWQILRVLDIYGRWFARQRGLPLPLTTGGSSRRERSSAMTMR